MYGNGDVMKYLEWTESEGKREKIIEREGKKTEESENLLHVILFFFYFFCKEKLN